MKITVIGTGYVGLVTGACLAEVGNHVNCIDIDQSKIDELKQGIMPIYEPGLEELVKRNILEGRLNFYTSLKEQPDESRVYFIAVGTPSDLDGSANLKFVRGVARDIGQYMTDYAVIIDKSTVPVGTADIVKDIIEEELKKRHQNILFDMVSNPEFLKEGAAIEDFTRPDRIVIGLGDSQKAKNIMRQLYAPYNVNHNRLIFMGIRDAEMTKYACNSILAAKISFMNEIANICEYLGADVENVRIGLGSDSRIGYKFIAPGCGYGGSCFPKDVKALIRLADKAGVDPHILKAVEARNNQQKHVLGRKLVLKLGEDLSGINIALWGLSFKPDTDDMREASSIVFLQDVISRGAKVKAYDPGAIKMAQKILPQTWFDHGSLTLVSNQYDVFQSADVFTLVTEWSHFQSPDFCAIKEKMRGNLILDGRNQYDPAYLRELGFDYVGIGR